MNIGGFLKTFVRTVDSNLPTILSGIGLLKVAESVVIAFKRGPRAAEALEEAKNSKAERENLEYGEVELTRWEKISTVAPVFWPVAVNVALGAGCMISSQCVSDSRLAAAMAAVTLNDDACKKLEDKIQEMFGPEAEKEIKNEIAKKDILEKSQAQNKGGRMATSLMFPGIGDKLFYEPYSNTVFRSDDDKITDAFIQANGRIDVKGYLSLTEWCDILQIPLIDPKRYDSIIWVSNENAEVFGLPFWYSEGGFLHPETGEFVTYLDYTHSPTVDGSYLEVLA